MADKNGAEAAMAASGREEVRPAAWWYAASLDGERWQLGGDTKEQAIAAGRADDYADGAPFCVAEARQQLWRFDCFDYLHEEFDGTNEELGDGNGDPPSVDAGIGTLKGGVKAELKEHLRAALEAWVRANGSPTAWALDFLSYHDVPATSEWHQAEQVSL